jgi:hypothetical protein
LAVVVVVKIIDARTMMTIPTMTRIYPGWDMMENTENDEHFVTTLTLIDDQ